MVNTRIKELEKKCWDHQTNHLDSEKFAELIVRECASVVFKKTGPKSALDVLEHFGIE